MSTAAYLSTKYLRKLTLYCAADTGVTTLCRREWNESYPHVCSLKWAVQKCISLTPRTGGWTWTGCASSMGVMMALHYTTNNRAPRHPVTCTSKWKVESFGLFPGLCGLKEWIKRQGKFICIAQSSHEATQSAYNYIKKHVGRHQKNKRLKQVKNRKLS